MIQFIIISVLSLYLAYSICRIKKLESINNSLSKDVRESVSKMKDIEHIVFSYDNVSTDIIEWMKDNAFFENAGNAKQRYDAWVDSVMKLGVEYKNKL